MFLLSSIAKDFLTWSGRGVADEALPIELNRKGSTVGRTPLIVPN